jgi:hypothetical protein
LHRLRCWSYSIESASGTKRETAECDQGIFVHVDYRLWFERGEQFVVLTTAIATETGPDPAAKGELLSWLKVPVVLSMVYAETLLEF